MNRSSLQRILDSTLKQSCSHQKFWRWEYKKHPTRKRTDYMQGLKNLLWTLRLARDNLIGSKYLYSVIKAQAVNNLRELQCGRCSKNDKKNWVVKHIGRVQRNECDEIQYLKRSDTQKHLLRKQYVAWHCNSYSALPISYYINNPVFQEFLLELDYFGTKSNEKIYIDLWNSLEYTDKIVEPSRNDSKLNVTIEFRNLLANKMRLRVWVYTNSGYLYILTDGSLTLKYKTYTIRGHLLDLYWYLQVAMLVEKFWKGLQKNLGLGGEKKRIWKKKTKGKNV